MKISAADFKKLVSFLAKEGQDGAPLRIDTGGGTKFNITTTDKHNKEISINISDIEYPFMPTVTRTETF